MEVIRSIRAAFGARRAERVERCNTFLDRIIVYLTVCFDVDVHPRSYWRIWLDCRSQATLHTGMRKFEARWYRKMYAEVAALVRAGVDADEFIETSPEDCARDLVALVDGGGVQLVLDAGLTPARARAIAENAIRGRLGVDNSRPELARAKRRSVLRTA